MAETDAFATALHLHQSGQLAQAERYYRAALSTHPSRAYVLVQLASVVQGQGRLDEAIELQRQSLAERPDVAEAWANLGTMLLSAGKLEESAAAQQRALSIRPDLAEAWVNLSATYRAWAKAGDALGAAQKACSLRPDLPQAQYQLGSSLRRLGRTREAIAALEQAVRISAQFFEAWYELGCSLLEENDPERARQALSHAQALRPESAEAACALGGVLCALGEWQGARSLYERSLRIRPDLIESRTGIAAVLRGEGRTSEAVEAYSQCVRSDPAMIEANRGLALSLFDQDLFDESLQVFENLGRLYPNNPAIQYELGCELLLRGDFLRGWPLFEKRVQVPRLAPLVPGTFPAWDGSELTGKRILVHHEQGHGDTLQFVRYVLSPRFRNAKIVLRCQGPLHPLMLDQFPVEAVVPDGRPLPAGIDCHCTLLSLPFMFRTDADSIPATVPYIRAAQQLVDTWQGKIGARRAKLRVGLAWAGNPAHPRDRRRSMAPGPLLEMAGGFGGEVEWFSLQKLQVAAASRPVASGVPLADHTAALTDFAQTAALISQLDLVITVDTSVAHLAGAMGIAVWVMLPHMPDWRWQLRRSDSPWYPTMRLFRQPRPGAWAEVLRDVSEALRGRLIGV